MRKLPVAFVTSLALHGAAIAYVVTNPPKPQKFARVTPAPAVEEVTAIELLDDHTAPGGSGTGVPTGDTSRSYAIATGHSSHGTRESAKPERPGQPGHSPLMTMRPPEMPKGGPSDEFITRFLENSKPLAPKDIASEQVADDLAHDRASLANPRWVANATADELTAQRFKLEADRERDAARELKPDGQGYKSEHLQFTAHTEADGTAHFNDAKNLQFHGPFHATFDISDAIMRDHGMDPYASAKRKWLDETRDERYAIGKAYDQKRLRKSTVLMEKNVARLLAVTADTRARKRGLFELWDDCAEAGSDDVLAGAKAARAFVLGVIRTEFPAGSANAFTADELAQLNAHRASRAKFAPYDEDDGPATVARP